MEVYQTDNHYIIQHGEYSLWCSRKHGTLEAKTGNDLCSAWNPICIGLVYGVVGKIKIHAESEWKLLLISKQTCVGQMAGEHDVYQINKVAVLSLSSTEPVDLELDLCAKHHFGMKRTERITQQADGQGKTFQKTWNQLKSAAENVKPKKRDVKDKEKFERRILEELMKMYNDTNSFYYCTSHDITSSVQRQYSTSYDKTAELWHRCDTRFFWNLHMLTELTEMKTELADHWILPIIQGSVDIQTCVLDFTSTNSKDLSPMLPRKQSSHHDKEAISYKMVLISRRSRHRAGTRSKRRGLDDTGACANYVETEQIIEFSYHRVSFVQVRGSIPVFWSQTGVKYRPPPKIDKGEAETHEAFRRHFDEQLAIYKTVNIVTLTELVGKEKVIGDAYLDNVLKYNSQDVTYITFDFHEYCRGMKFENVSILTSSIKDIVKHMRYCWVDRKGMICQQRGVFRVNCVDCLDRTNVVQTAIARIVMETQCRKLGLLAPDETLPENCRKIFQQMWANTGDAISKQYAGTVALKGDFTRTGERKISGMMKDGVNSANRYYLRFKDTYRQAAIDLTHGHDVSEDVLDGKLKGPEDDIREMLEKEENVKQLIEDCKKMLIVEPEECLGGWSLVNADPIYGDIERQEMDIVLLLSQRAVYVAWYEDEEEQVNEYQRIFLEDIEKLEIGAEHSLFKSKNIVMRLHYRHYADEGFFHTFKAPGTRLFNNLVIPVNTPDEAKEQLSVVCEAFGAAQTLLKLELTVEEKIKLDKRKTRPHPEVMDIHQQLQENSLATIKLPRDVSSSDIPSGATSSASSPRMPRRNSPNLRQPGTNEGEKSTDNRALSQSEKQLNRAKNLSSKTAMMKNWLASVPKISTGGNTDISVPNINIKSLNIVSKIKSGGAGASRFLSKVPGTSIFYRKDPGVDETDVFIGGLEHVDVKTSKSRERTTSRDDTSVDDAVELTEADLEKQEVMLGSCGILATNAKQIIQSPQCSFDDSVPDESNNSIGIHIDEDSVEDYIDINMVESPTIPSVAGKKTDPQRLDEPRPKGRSSSFQSSFTSYVDIGADQDHQTGDAQDVWVKRTDTTFHQDKPIPKPHDLNLGQARVQDNSEADRILAKYSRPKGSLTHPNMRNSFSDSALASQAMVSVTDYSNTQDSPKSVLELNFEINSDLQMKLPNLLQSAKMPRKTQRIYEALKARIERKLGDGVCHSTFIFV